MPIGTIAALSLVSYMLMATHDIKAKRILTNVWYVAYGAVTVALGFSSIGFGVAYLVCNF